VLKPSGVLEDSELDVSAAVPQNVSVAVATVEGEPGHDDDPLGDQPHGDVLGQMDLSPIARKKLELVIKFQYSSHRECL